MESAPIPLPTSEGINRFDVVLLIDAQIAVILIAGSIRINCETGGSMDIIFTCVRGTGNSQILRLSPPQS
jgi:hypothetical protein